MIVEHCRNAGGRASKNSLHVHDGLEVNDLNVFNRAKNRGSIYAQNNQVDGPWCDNALYDLLRFQLPRSGQQQGHSCDV